MKTIATIMIALATFAVSAVAELVSPSGKIEIGTVLFTSAGEKVGTVMGIGEEKSAAGQRVRTVKIKMESGATEWKNRETVIQFYRVKR